MKFKDRNLSGVTTVDQLQATMDAAGINPFEYVIWKHQRPLWSPMGSYQVTPVEVHPERRLAEEHGPNGDELAVIEGGEEASSASSRRRVSTDP